QMLVVEGEGLVIVVDLGQMRIGKNLRENREPAALLRCNLAVLLALPAAAPALLILPIFWITNARLGLDIVKPRIFHTLTRGPDVLAGPRAGMAPDAFVEVHHHRD